MTEMTGGCLCGGVRYRIDGPIQGATAHCHCTMCRRASGAPVVTWFTVKTDDYAVTKGAPGVYRSSEKAERTFCPTCGAQLTFRTDEAPGFVDVTLATLDDPENHPATLHIWTESRLPWLHLDEHLPEKRGDGASSG